MKLRSKISSKNSLITLVLVGTGVGILLGIAHGAGSSTLSLSPASGGHDINSTFTITVNENSGSTGIGAAQADLSYDTSKLQFVSASGTGNSFVNVSAQGGNGSVSIIDYVQPIALGGQGSLTGSQVMGTVTFKALVGSGSTSVSFANSSSVLSLSDHSETWNGVTTGGTYTLTTPVTPPATTTPTTTAPTSSSSGSGSSSSSSGSSTTKKTTTTTPTTTTTAPTVAEQLANPSEPIPVAAAAASQGYLVAIKVVDSKGKAVEGATVSFNGKTSQSDITGIAGFASINAGNYIVNVKSKSGNATSKITVSTNKSPTAVQEFTATVKPATPWLMIEIGAGVLVVLAIGLWVLRWKLMKNRNTASFAPPDAANTHVYPDLVEPAVSMPAALQPAGNDAAKPAEPVFSIPNAPVPSPGVVVQPQNIPEKQ